MSRSAALFMLGCAALFCIGPACSLFTKQNAKTALDVAEIACVIAHAAMPDSDVAQVCGIANELIPDMRRVLGETRAQRAQAAREAVEKVGACKPSKDAGPQ